MRLLSLSVIGLMFAGALFLVRTRVQGWTFYLATTDIAFELLLHLIFSALVGIALSGLCIVLVTPFLWYFDCSRAALAERATKGAAILFIFLVSRYALQSLIKWTYQWSDHRAIFDRALLAAFYLGFVGALCVPRARRELLASLNGFLGKRIARGIAVTTIAAASMLAAGEFTLSKTLHTVKAVPEIARPKSNFLLITFDALSAEDMSLYGYKLPTTPNIDAFASKSTVFTNFYSASTFTTPSIAAILTSAYPSETHVHQLRGRLQSRMAVKSLPHFMRSGGYATAAFLSNPFAYYVAMGLEGDYDALPEPRFQHSGAQRLWEWTRLLHQDSGIGSRIDEYFDLEDVWSTLARLPENLSLRFRAHQSFEQATHVLDRMPSEGFFLWVHVMTPHDPYLPDPAERGRFLPPENVHTYEEESGGRWKPHYEPDQQALVSERRLRYDEFTATADRAFGAFMRELERRGRLQDTTIIVSADHGESFEGGIYQHQTPYLTRPVLHIPLIIKAPLQRQARKVAFTVDQTALAPTILELAGQPIPQDMRAQSLVRFLEGTDRGEAQGLAFAQYLEKNSVFKPLHHGTVGVMDGQYQYVFDLETQKGSLRPLRDAHIWNLDHTTENPARAEQLRGAICSRFPGLCSSLRSVHD